MTDNKLTDVTNNNVEKISDNEIIKALECWLIDLGYENIATDTEEYICLLRETLDLINRLQTEIERLEKNIETETNHITRLENQIERLLQRIKTIKSEAYKECFALIKNNLFIKHKTLDNECLFEFSGNDLDNLLEELVGENK